jgi:hypothetical protein
MDLKVPKKCDRCGRVEDVIMTETDVAALVETTNKKAEELKRINEFGRTLDTELAPTLVMFVKNSEGGYDSRTLDILCSRPDATRNKGCEARVQELLSDIFDLKKDEVKKPRKPREKKIPTTGQE